MPRGLRKVRFSFDDPHLTHYGGMFLFHQFCRKLQLNRLFQTYVPWQRRDTIYHPTELILCILLTMIAGLKRISDTKILAYNSSFQNLLGLFNFPVPSTIRNFLKDLTPEELQGIIKVHDLLRKKMWNLSGPKTNVIFDLDSTVLIVFGWKIEKAKKGYSPWKRNRPSYHPLICFEGHTQDTVHGMLRPGNTQPVTAAREIWKECKKKIPKYANRKRVSIRVRADAGFYDGKFIEPLDAEGVGYVIVADMTRPLRAKASSSRYRTFRKKKKWQVTHFTYHPLNWDKPHSFVITRRPKPQDPEEQKQQQLTLWEFKDYYYHAFVYNLPLKPASVYRFYTPRARVELDIRELKESFPLGKIPSRSFQANSTHFELILFAYDLVNWFRRLCLPGKWQKATLHTLRTELLVLPARLLNIENYNVLKLPPRYVHQKMFREAAKKIEKLHIP